MLIPSALARDLGLIRGLNYYTFLFELIEQAFTFIRADLVLGVSEVGVTVRIARMHL